jgi:5'-nucleotidase
MTKTLKTKLLAHYLAEYKKRWPERPFIPLENRVTFLVRDDYKNQLGITDPNLIYEEPGWFFNLPPNPGAVEIFEYLFAREDLEVFICSSPCTNYKHCVTEKYQWVEKYLGRKGVNVLMLCKDKTIVNVSKFHHV